MEHAVFTYGTLLSGRVLSALLGRIPERAEGNLHGYRRRPIRDQCYPAVLKADKADVVRGKVLMGISSTELALLDAFEDPAYDRIRVPIKKENGDSIEARLWARPDSNTDDLIPESDWDEDKFMKSEEDWYVEGCIAWAAAYRKNLDPKS